MKRLIVIAVVALTAGIGATAAPAQDTSTQSLASQISTLKAQVRTLQKRVTKLEKAHKETRDIAISALGWGICLGAVTADAFQGTWAVIDQIGQATQQKNYIGAQPTVDDQGICRNFANIFRSASVPPTMSVFSSLYALLRSSAAFRDNVEVWTH
jgi:hypothetical protein